MGKIRGPAVRADRSTRTGGDVRKDSWPPIDRPSASKTSACTAAPKEMSFHFGLSATCQSESLRFEAGAADGRVHSSAKVRIYTLWEVQHRRI